MRGERNKETDINLIIIVKLSNDLLASINPIQKGIPFPKKINPTRIEQ